MPDALPDRTATALCENCGEVHEIPSRRVVLRSVWKTLAGIGPDDDRARIEDACTQIEDALR